MSVDTEPTLLRSVSSTVEVEYRSFLLWDAGDTNEPPSPVNDWFQPERIGASFTSGGSDHFPAVTMELWSAQPPVDGSWELSAEHQVFLPTATARLCGLMSGPSPEILELPDGRQWFHLRASVRGRAAIEAIYTDTSLWPIRDIEVWVLQFW